MAIWKPLPGKTENQQVDFGGGVNTNDPPHLIGGNQATSMKNLMPYNTPVLTTAYPKEQLGGTLAGSVKHLTTFGAYELLCVSDGKLKKWNGSAWADVYSGLTSAEYSSCNFSGSLLLGTQGNKIIEYNGISAGPITGAPLNAKYITASANRVFAITSDNDVQYCALNTFSDWTTTGETGAGSITIEAPSGESNTGITALTSGRVIVFKSTSFHEITGTGPINYEVIDRLYGVGCIANSTIVAIEGFLYWLGLDGIYRWGGAGVPVRISDPIKDYIPDSQVGVFYNHHCAGTDGRFYFISLGNNQVFAFDTHTAKWWGPLDYGVSYVYAFGRLTGTAYKGLYIGDIGGKVHRIDDDEATGAVSFEWVTGAFAEGSLSRDKQLIYGVLTAEVYTGATLSVYMSNRIRDLGDGNDWKLIKSVTAATLPQKVKIPVSPSLLAPSEFYRLKFSGAGRVDIYGIDKEMYVNPRA